ncbi:LysM peptidoglycan-binding domain-containing protein [Corallincola luteus]|uniref:LysM peptidoglycan-binding domain-containing protein n=1 Tax=Corallincola luteus TaxID=1775177 RepID=A0ABY2AT55_9GAMM|nr:LysM peptidoglycan-binding domain-containing protein [Corallincola luteus]TCI05472.1 LysM peptidoglycan-binding domain-containing protein [Corallincola luteus]
MKLPYSASFSLLALLLAGCQSTPTTTAQVADTNDNNQVQTDVIAPVTAVTEVAVDEEVIPADPPAVEMPEEQELSATPVSEEPLPPTYDDLWLRIADQLHIEVPDNKRVTSQRNWYKKHPSYMDRVAKRADPYLFLIVEKIEQRGLPLELALLPIVESAFDPFAYSHGRASGIWQFIPGTGKRFGLDQNWWYDGRRDISASTDAALDYLEYLNRYFKGDWLHALAAYNSGEGRVRSAIKKNKRLGKPTDFWSLSLPKETRAYVPKLLALGDLLKRRDEYGMSWMTISNQPKVVEIETGSQIDLALAADLAGLSVDQLHKLNPAFNRWATSPDGPHALLIPVEKAEQFTTKLASLERTERLNWVRHRVKSGDSLNKLAKQYHTSTGVIRDVNKLKGNTIRVGEHLLIPVAASELSSYGFSADQRLAKTQTKPRASQRIDYKVKSGDSLWEIAKRHKVNVRQLAKWNGMAPTDTLRLNQKLVIWKKGKPATTGNGNATTRKIAYKVRSGDSLARIASKFKVSISDLMQWNQLDKNKYLQPGQMLRLYVDVTQISS